MISSGGHFPGRRVGIGVEIDLGPRMALRVPLEIAYAGSSNNDAAGVEHSTLFLFVGLVARGRLPLSHRAPSTLDAPTWEARAARAASCSAASCSASAPNPPPATMQEFTRLGAAPDLTAGFLFTPVRWFSLRIAVDYTYIFVAHTSVHALSETFAPQFSF